VIDPLPVLGTVKLEGAVLRASLFGGVSRARLDGRPLVVHTRPVRDVTKALTSFASWLRVPRHPNVVRALGVGSFGPAGVYVAFEDFTEPSIVHSRLPIEDALRLFDQVCDALIAAHEEGLVHGQLNRRCLLGSKDDVRIEGFGFAAVQFSGLSLEQNYTEATLAPEIVYQGMQPTPRSDVYGIASALTEAIIPKGAAASRRYGPGARKPLRDLLAHAPPWLDAALERALAEKPEDRFASVAELRKALRQKSADR
jgi:serine/threonine-protein kinase